MLLLLLLPGEPPMPLLVVELLSICVSCLPG